jgi:hypothetical protein
VLFIKIKGGEVFCGLLANDGPDQFVDFLGRREMCPKNVEKVHQSSRSPALCRGIRCIRRLNCLVLFFVNSKYCHDVFSILKVVCFSFTQWRSRWKTSNLQMRRASLGVREQAKTRGGCNDMTACHAGWRDVARSDAQESRKASGKTANRENTHTVDKIV